MLSPAVSDALRDATGSFNAAVYLDAGIILLAFVLLLFVREPGAVEAAEVGQQRAPDSV